MHFYVYSFMDQIIPFDWLKLLFCKWNGPTYQKQFLYAHLKQKTLSRSYSSILKSSVNDEKSKGNNCLSICMHWVLRNFLWMQLKQNISILVHKLMHFISAIISGGLSAMLAQFLSFLNSVFKSTYPNLTLNWHFCHLATYTVEFYNSIHLLKLG